MADKIEGMKKKGLGNLQEQLRSAGLISTMGEERLQKEEEEAEAKKREKILDNLKSDTTARGITKYFIALRSATETFDAAIERANSWIARLENSGHGQVLDDLCLKRIARSHPPVPPAQIIRFEKENGVEFPQSYKAFLEEIGGLSFWGRYTTIPLEEAGAAQEQVQNILDSFAQSPRELEGSGSPFVLHPLCGFDSNFYFYLLGGTGGGGESEIFFVYHDEGSLYGPWDNTMAWLSGLITDEMENALSRISASR